MKKKNIVRRVGGILNPAYLIDTYWSYRPAGKKGFTKNMVGDIPLQKTFSAKSYKELLQTLKSAESKHSFKRSMQKEGIVEKDLAKGHKMYSVIMMISLLLMLYPIYRLFDLYHLATAGQINIFSIISTSFVILVSIYFLIFNYIYFAWRAFRVRNKSLITFLPFLQLCMKDKDHLFPFEDFDRTVEKIEAEKKQKSKKK